MATLSLINAHRSIGRHIIFSLVLTEGYGSGM